MKLVQKTEPKWQNHEVLTGDWEVGLALGPLGHVQELKTPNFILEGPRFDSHSATKCVTLKNELRSLEL